MRRTLLRTLIGLSLFWVLPYYASAAATLSIVPLEGKYPIGADIPVSVSLDSKGVSVNAVEGKIKYLPDEFEVVSVDRSDTPLKSWTIEPDWKSEPGTVSFGGIVPDGFIASGKALFTITFKALRSGEARIRVASGAAISAEDGKGTNILTDLRGGVYAVTKPDSVFEARDAGPAGLRSTSHPDQNAWYSASDVILEWSRKPETDSERFSVDQNPEGTPTTLVDAATEGKKVTLESGVWYGHLSLHDHSGWGPIGHLRVQIDTERPDALTVNEIPRTDPTDPKPTIEVAASDTRSGISHYEFTIDGGTPERREEDGNHRYQIGPLPPGNHIVVVRAFDRAGNSLAETLSVSVASLKVPVIMPVSGAVFAGGDIDIEGEVSEGATARVSIIFENGEPKTEEVASGPGGKFIHTFVFPQVGTYRLKVQSVDKRGATSDWTPDIVLSVTEKSLLGAVGATAGSSSGILIPLSTLVAGILIGMAYMRGKRGTGVLAYAPAANVSEETEERSEKRSILKIVTAKVAGVVSLLRKRRGNHDVAMGDPDAFEEREQLLSSRLPSRMAPIVTEQYVPRTIVATKKQSVIPATTLSRREDPIDHEPTILDRR